MPEKPASEKTEQPTPRRLRKAREEGMATQSQELPAAVSVIVLTAVFALMAPFLMQWFMGQMKQGMSCQTGVFSGSKTFSNFFNAKIADSMLISIPVLAALFVSSIASCVVVSGLNFAPKAIRFKPNAINPVEGFRKLFNVKSLVNLGISIAKLIFISIIVWMYLQSRLDQLAAIRWAYSAAILAVIAKTTLGMLIRVGIALIVIATIDVLFQRWKHTQELKMTRQEVKLDRKDSDGSPEVKSRIRRIQIEMTQKRMLQEVPKANVVLVNPDHVAVAIRYDVKTMNTPVVVSKGADHLAEKIREIARAYGVPIIRRPELARTLYSTVDVGGAIPESLYIAVAEVLAMIYRLRHRK